MLRAGNIGGGKFGVLLAVAIVCAGLLFSAVEAAPSTPRIIVSEFHKSLLEVMKNAKKLGYRGRLAALEPEVSRAFHLPLMTRVVAGKHWKTFSLDQKKTLVHAFGRMTTATYAHRFDGYGGEYFRFLEEIPVRSRSVLVKTHLVKTDGEAIKLDYLVRRFKSGWRVIDIYLEGSFSELATRRSEYSSVLKREGLDGLIAEINSKVATYESDDAG